MRQPSVWHRSGGLRRPSAQRPPSGPAVAFGAVAAGACLVVWAAGEVGGLVGGGAWPPAPPSSAGAIAVRLLAHPANPANAWPAGARALIPGPAAYYVTAALLAAAVAGTAMGGVWCARRPRAGRARESSRGAAWAGRRDLETLSVKPPSSGRLVVGRCGRRHLATEPQQSVIVIGPTQSHKTTGFAIPAILEWDGPVLATSVKSDLVRDTMSSRSSRGEVWLYDPSASSGMRSSGWSPLTSSVSWPGARRMASALCSTARSRGDTMVDGDFWYATAAKLIAPLLFAAASSGHTMADVVRWVDTQEVREVAAILAAQGVPEAEQSARATWAREDRQLSSVYTTAETVLEAFSDPVVARSAAQVEIDTPRFLGGGAHTLYVCAPTHEQSRLRSVFVALVSEVLAGAYLRVAATGRPLSPPLLVVLDEAANVAPLGELDAVAATAAGHGIQLVSIWQDIAQISARYGPRAATVVNNHRAKVVLSGISDPSTLEHVSALLGDEELMVASRTTDVRGGVTTTESLSTRRLAPADALRRIRPGHGVLVYGHLPPARLELRPWYKDRRLVQMAAGGDAPG